MLYSVKCLSAEMTDEVAAGLMASTTEEGMSQAETESDMLKPGTTLLTCEPFAYSSFLQDPELPVCDTCLIVKETGLLRCTSCKSVFYCNRSCQKKGWKDGHNLECDGLPALIRKFEAAPPTIRKTLIWKPRILFRIFMKLKDGTDYFDELDIGGVKVKRRFSDLLSHCDELLADNDHREEVYQLTPTLKDFIGSKIKVPTVGKLIEICGRVNLNAFDIGDGFNSVGAGVYLGGSILNHSCSPTAFRMNVGPTMHVRNIVEIPRNLPIDKVTISYTCQLMPSQERRKDLKKLYHFHCVCERCETGQFDKEMRSVICTNGGCNAKIDTEEMKKKQPCSSCGHVMGMEGITKVLETEKYVGRLLDVYDLDLGFVEAVMQTMKSANFSDSHWMMVKFLKRAYDNAAVKDSSGEVTDMKKAFEYGSKYSLEIKRYLPQYDEHLMWHLFEMSWFAVCLEELDEAEKYMSEARSMGKVLHGTNSLFMRTRIGPLQERIGELKMIRLMNQLGLTSMQAST